MPMRERVSGWMDGIRHAFQGRRGRIILALVVLVLIVAGSWSVRSAVAPGHRAGDPVRLDGYGFPGVELRLVYPVRVPYRGLEDTSAILTVYALAAEPGAAQPLELFFPLPDSTLAFVDAQGIPVPGRLTVIPGYPDALPYSLLLAHADTQLQPTLFSSRGVRIIPQIRTADGAVAIPELAFRTKVESRLNHTLRSIVLWLSAWGLPAGLVIIVVASLWRVWYGAVLRRRQAREQRLSALYTRLRDEIKVENWPVARERVEELRLLAPSYRDLDQLDTLISTAETGAWRREQLYNAGLDAYRRRDWAAAVQAFAAVEEETPYYRDVRFMRRTAALAADLHSRDRSLRLQAAIELGDVADLLDMTPLLRALGDSSKEVADAAEASFARVGPPAFDALIEGLTADRISIRERSYRLLQGMGQSVRDQLLNALHSPDPRITAPVARLLVGLGARQTLARALLTTGPEHHEGIIEALLSEDNAAAEPLVDALLEAPEGSEEVVIRAIAALRVRTDIDHYLEARLRAAPSSAARHRIQRAMRAPAEAFVGLQLATEDLDGEPAETIEEAGPQPEPPAAIPARPARRLLFGGRR